MLSASVGLVNADIYFVAKAQQRSLTERGYLPLALHLQRTPRSPATARPVRALRTSAVPPSRIPQQNIASRRILRATAVIPRVAMSAVPTLTYFPITGRAEIARLCFTLGGIEYKEKTVTPSEWPSYKPTTPFGALPLLEIGDKIVSQSAGIDHHAAKLGGFLPEDPIAALLSDEAYYFVTQDIHATLLSPTRKLEGDAGVKAREQLAAGPLQDRLAQLDKLVAKRPGKFIAGDKLSIGDFAILNLLGMFKSGFWSGIPSDVFDHFTALKAYRNQVASEPGVKSFYEQKTDDVRVKGYRPDAA